MPITLDEYRRRFGRDLVVAGAAEAPTAGWSDLGGAALDRAQGQLWGIAEAVTGSEFAQRQRLDNLAVADMNRAKAMRDLGAPDSFRDVTLGANAGKYVGGLLVNSWPELAASVGTAGAGALAGLGNAARLGLAGANTYVSGLGDVLQNQRDEAGRTNLGAAGALAVPYAAADLLGLDYAIAAGRLPKLGMRGLDELGGLKGVAARGVTNTGITALSEGVGETFQEMANQGGRIAVNPNQTMFNPEANERYLESFVGGAAMGGTLAAPAGSWGRSQEYQNNQELQAAVLRETRMRAQQEQQQQEQQGPKDLLRIGYEQPTVYVNPAAGADTNLDSATLRFNDGLDNAPRAVGGLPVSAPVRYNAQTELFGEQSSTPGAAPVESVEELQLRRQELDRELGALQNMYAQAEREFQQTGDQAKWFRSRAILMSHLEKLAPVKQELDARLDSVSINTPDTGVPTSQGRFLFDDPITSWQTTDTTEAVPEADKRDARAAAPDYFKGPKAGGRAKTLNAIIGDADPEGVAARIAERWAAASKDETKRELADNLAAWYSAFTGKSLVKEAPANVSVPDVSGLGPGSSSTQGSAVTGGSMEAAGPVPAPADGVPGTPASVPADTAQAPAVGDAVRGAGTAPLKEKPAKPAKTPKAPGTGKLADRLKGKSVVIGGAVDFKALKLVLEREDPKMHQAVRFALGVDKDGDRLDKPLSTPEAAARMGVSRSELSRVMSAIGLDKETRNRFFASSAAANERADGVEDEAAGTTTDIRNNDEESDMVDGERDAGDTSSGVVASAGGSQSNIAAAPKKSFSKMAAYLAVKDKAPADVSDEALAEAVAEGSRYMSISASPNDKTGERARLDEAKKLLAPLMAEATRRQRSPSFQRAVAAAWERANPDSAKVDDEAKPAEKDEDAEQETDAADQPQNEAPADTAAPAPAPQITKKKTRKIVKPSKGKEARYAYLSAADLRRDLEGLFNRGLGRKVVVVETFDDLANAMSPAELENVIAEELADPGALQAFVANGRAFLIADRIEEGEGRAVFLHEVGVHLGLEKQLPTEAFNKLAGLIKSWAKISEPSNPTERFRNAYALRAVARLMDAGTPAADRNSELVAYFVEEAVRGGVTPKAMLETSVYGMAAQFIRRIMAAFNAALQKFGVAIDKVMPNDIVDMAYGAAQIELYGNGAQKAFASAEAEAKFKAWFGKSTVVNEDGSPKIMYHGTAQDVENFQPKQANAIFLTDDPEFAEGFAASSEYWMRSNPQKWMEPDDFAKMLDEAEATIRKQMERSERVSGRASPSYIDASGYLRAMQRIKDGAYPTSWPPQVDALVEKALPSSQNIIPLYVKAERPFDYMNRADVDKVVAALPTNERGAVVFNATSDEPSTQRPEAVREAILRGEWGVIERADVQAAIKLVGFDSVYVTENGRRNLAVYSSTQVKSAVGNKDFDPRDKRIQKSVSRRNVLLGAAASAAVGYPALTTGPLTTGKAVPLTDAEVDAKVSADVEKLLRDGQPDGTTSIDGAKAIKAALNKMAEVGPVPLRALAKQTADLIPADRSIMLTIDSKRLVNVHGAVEFTGFGPHLQLFTAQNRSGLTYGTILHEAMHLAVAARYHTLSVSLARDNDAKLGGVPNAAAKMEQFRKVWEEFDRWVRFPETLKTTDPETYLALTQAQQSPDEFFVRALTDAKFQQALAKMKYGQLSLYERFKDWVRGLFFKEGIEASWLDAALLASDELMTAMSSDKADFARSKAVRDVRANSRMNSLVAPPAPPAHVTGTQPLPKVEQAIRTLPVALRPSARAVAQLLRSVGRKVLNTAAFTDDLLDRAASMGIKSAEKYKKLARERAASIGHQERMVLDVVTGFNELDASMKGKDGPVNQYLWKTTTREAWGFQPDWLTEKVEVDKEMQEAFDALPAPAQKVVKDILRHGHDTLKAKKQLVQDMMVSEYDALIAAETDPEAKKALEADKAKAVKSSYGSLMRLADNKPYAPIKRFGSHVVIAKSQEYLDAEANLDQKLMRELEAKEEHYYVDFAEGEIAAAALEDQLAAKPGYAFTQYREIEEQRNDLYGGSKTLKAIGDLKAKIEGMPNSAERKQLATMLQEMYLLQLGEDTARKSELRRRKIAGDIDMIRSFETQGLADARFMGQIQYGQPMLETMNDMRREVKDNKSGDPNAKSEVFNELIKRHLQAMDYEPTPVVNALTRMSSMWFLATSPSYYLQNATQPWMMSLPYMAAKHDYGKMSGLLSKAYTDVWGPLKDAKMFGQLNFKALLAAENKSLTDGEKAMIRSLLDADRIDIGMANEIGQITAEVETRTAKGAYAKVDNSLRGLQQKLEAVNRLTTALAAYRAEVADGVSEADATAYADDVIQRTHGDYSSWNAPRAFNTRGGKIMLQFRKYQLIQLTMMAKLFNNSFGEAKTPEEKAQKIVARKALRNMMAQAFVVGGGKALPAGGLIAYAFSKLFGDEDEPPETTFRKMVGNEDIADMLLYGAPSVIGVNGAPYGGWGNSTSILPFVDLDLASRKGVAEAGYALLSGPFGGLTLRAADGIGYIQNGDYWRGLENLLPKGFTNFSKAIREGSEGTTNRRGDQLLSSEEISYWNGFQQSLGVTPLDTAKRMVASDALYKTRTAVKEEGAAIKKDFLEARKDRDTAAMAEARKQWAEYQDRRVRLGFDRQPLGELMKAGDQQRNRERLTRGGVQYRKGEEGFAEELAVGEE